MKVVLATGNAHKVEEIGEILGVTVDLSAFDTGVDETGTTFEDNALLKARAASAATGLLALADDSGIEIDALGGAPGIHSARWTEEHDWIPRVLRELEGVAPPARTARFVSAAAAVWWRATWRRSLGVMVGLGTTRSSCRLRATGARSGR